MSNTRFVLLVVAVIFGVIGFSYIRILIFRPAEVAVKLTDPKEKVNPTSCKCKMLPEVSKNELRNISNTKCNQPKSIHR